MSEVSGMDAAFPGGDKTIKAIYSVDSAPPYDEDAVREEAIRRQKARHRVGTRFIVEVPKGYDAKFHTGIDGTLVIAIKHEDGNLPLLYLHQDGDKFSWKDHSPNKPLKILVEEEKK